MPNVDFKNRKEEVKAIKKVDAGKDVMTDEEIEEFLEEEVIEDPYGVDMKSLQEKIQEKFPEEIVRVLKRICYEISEVGLSEQEACVLSSYSYAKLQKLKKDEPLIDELISLKVLQYEREILRNLSRKAKMDDKLGQWMLERRNPDKYNRKKGTGGGAEGDDSNMMAMAVEFIQQTSDQNNIVSEKSGKALVVKKGRDADAVKLAEFLK